MVFPVRVLGFSHVLVFVFFKVAFGYFKVSLFLLNSPLSCISPPSSPYESFLNGMVGIMLIRFS